MTTLTDTQVITASGGLVELGYSEITSIATVTSSTLGAGTQVIGPLTVVCDGGPILIEFYTPRVQIKTAAGSSITITLNQNGSELIRTFALVQSSATATTNPLVPIKAVARITPSAGTHTFSISAVTSGGPGSCFVYAGTGTTDNAPSFLRVSKIVRATQWPAVTTGTIICTSSTRPASPFVGQSIYETDTSLAYTYNGSAWVQTGNSTGAWTAFTPTWTNLTVGNGTTGARYAKVGRTVTYAGFITWGSTTSATSGYTTVSIPFTSANQSGYEWQGTARISDAGTRGYPGECGIGSNATTMTFHHPEAGNFGAVNSTNPMTWTTNDSIYWTITYEAAS